MKERPINLRDWEVRAILDDRKTQLRRVVKPQPDHFHRDSCARIVQQHQQERAAWDEMRDRLSVVRRADGGVAR